MKCIKFVVLICFLVKSVWAISPSKWVVFGDSLSDNQNTYISTQHKFPVSPLYFKGRFSNGLIWVDFITEKLSATNQDHSFLNYSIGGAAILAPQGQSLTLNQEVNSYLSEHASKADPNSLFVFWIGANDYLVNPMANEEQISTNVKELQSNVEILIQKGAHHVMIMTLPDLGDAPFSRMFGLAQQLSFLTTRHNELLNVMFSHMQDSHPDIELIFFDVNQQLWNSIMHDGTSLQFTKNQDPCFAMLPYRIDINNIDLNADNSCQGFAFFDQLHPTSAVHELLAKHLMMAVQH